jgi:hypothetical protein
LTFTGNYLYRRRYEKELMNNYFPAGSAARIAIVLYFYSVGFLTPAAGNQTPGEGSVTALLRQGRERSKIFPVIDPAIPARWPQEGGSCEVTGQNV